MMNFLHNSDFEGKIDKASTPKCHYGWSEFFEHHRPAFPCLTVRICAVHRDAFDVMGTEFTGRIHSHFFTDPMGGRPTIGDWIALHPQTHHILMLYPRKSLIKRRKIGKSHQFQAIAANIDTVFIVTSANFEFNIPRLERYLALVEEAGAHPVIVVTKIDLAIDRTSFIEQAANIRANLDVVAVNARDRESVNALNPWLYKGETIALMGSSGVGKSSLINTLLGQDLHKTSAVREQDSKGRHTTSARSMSMLTTQTWLIDTPGMREIQMMDTSGVEGVFDDIEQLALHCRFTNCAHDSEKDCAVQAAIASTELDVARFERFKKMKSENDSLSHFGTKSHSRRRKKT